MKAITFAILFQAFLESYNHNRESHPYIRISIVLLMLSLSLTCLVLGA